jgi:DNA-binding SARP family transcriptional activator
VSRSSSGDLVGTLSEIRLCGALSVVVDGRAVELRGRQARLIVAFMAVNRHRAVARAELLDLLWPEQAPAEPEEVLSALLSKLRSALGPEALEGRRELRLALPARIDLETAEADLARAEAAFERRDWMEACRAGHDLLDATDGPFLLGHDHAWVDERRREIEEMRLRTLEAMAASGIALGGSGIGAAERCARAIVATSPFREGGHRLLMEALAARGDVAEALRAYEALRRRLDDELGTAPGVALRELHTRLLTEGAPAAAPPRDERKLVTVVAFAAPPRDLDATLVTGGGRAVAVFGVPQAREDDAERAVRAALRAGRAGVATGEVLVRDGEPAGDPLQRAGALLSDAGVVADELTARLTEHAIAYERAGSTFVARGTRPVRQARRHPLVGREHELALLDRLHRTVVEERRPRLVAIVGDAGAGKSRLVEELVRRIAPAASVHTGRCPAYGDGLTYWPLRELLWSVAGIGLADTAGAAAGKLRTLVDRVAGEPDRTAAALAASAGISLPDSPLARLQPESVAEEVALAWPRFASGLAAQAPTVLVVEDLHWAEPALLDMVELVVARSAGPLLVVATARPELLERRPGWGARTASQLTLEPLTHDESARLVAALLPGADDELRTRVVSAAEGNPFFAEEIAQHLLEREDARAVPIPTTVRAVLAARVDALPAAEKRTLQDAAVIGRSFWASGLAPGATAPLRALEDRGLVVTRPSASLPGQTELAFRHALIREVAYRSIPDERLRTAHASVGEWLEDLAGDRREEFVALLAHHFERAGEPLRAKAVAALVEAGEAARRRAAAHEAVKFADRALALARRAGECLAALEVRARALHAAVRADEALSAYLSALELADEPDAERLRAYAVLLCSRYPGAFTRGDWKPWAVRAIEDGLAGAAGERATFETGALLIGRASMVRWFELAPPDLAEARAAAERAIEIAEAIGSTQLLSHGLEALGWRDADSGFCEAGATADRMLDLIARMADRVEAAESWVIAAVSLQRAGRHAQARETAAEARRAAVRLSPHRRLHAASAQTVCLLPAGRLGELGEAVADAADLALDEGSRTCAMASLSIAGLAVAHFEALEPEAGDRAAALVEVTGLHRADSSFRLLGIEVLRPFVGLERTRARLERADSARGLVDGVHHLRARLQLAALSGDAVAELAARGQAIAREACAPALGWIADWALALEAGELTRALTATAALRAYGERYTAARLEVDALARMPDDDAAGAAAARLERMGALRSAAELSGSPAG